MKGQVSLVNDWRMMGFAAYIPLLAAIFVVLLSQLMVASSAAIFPLLEYILPLFAAWWSIYLFQDIIDEQGGEVILTYPIKRRSLGIYRVITCYLFYLILVLIVVGLVDLHLAEVDMFLSMSIQLTAQTLFYAGFGFLVMVLVRRTIWALIIVISYATTQILTKGQLLDFINIYFFNQDDLPLEILWQDALYIALAGIVMALIAQMIFSRKEYI